LRLYFSHIRSFCYIVFSFASISVIAQNNLDGKQYYWEDTDNKSPYYYSKSTIELKGDSLVIIDYPNDPAGSLSYRSGTFSYNADSTLVKCIITRSLLFSLNTIQVTYYSIDCNENVEFSIGADKTLVSKIDLNPQYLIKNIDRPNRCINLQYSLQDVPIQLLFSQWYFQFESFENNKRLQPCP